MPARRQRLGRRSAGLGREDQGRRAERLHLRDCAAPGLGRMHDAVRPRGADRRSGMGDAGGAAAQTRQVLRDHRTVDHDQGQGRAHGDPQRAQRALRSDPIDEGSRRRTVAQTDGHGGRGGSPDPRQIPDRGEPHQAFGLAGRREELAAPGRAHRRDPEPGSGPLGR